MEPQQIITLAILLAMTGLLLSDRLRADLVALLVVFALGITGVLAPQETFAGFSRSAVITIMAVFVLTEGLQRTGTADRIGAVLLRLGGNSERRLAVIVMVAGACLSLFMNNIAAAAVLLPAVSGVARRGSIHPARLLMPLAFATILGGMATLLTSGNIVVSSLLRDQGLASFSLLDFAPVGVPIVCAGIGYMAIWGQRRLPSPPAVEPRPAARPSEGDLVEIYRLGERLFQVQVPAGSKLIGKPLSDSTFREQYGLNVLAIERQQRSMLSLAPNTVLQQGDKLLVAGRVEEFRSHDVEPHLEILPSRPWSEQDLRSRTIVVFEAVLAPRSSLIEQTLRAAHFREKYGMTVMAIWRAGRPIRTGLRDQQLQFGDVLLLQGPRERLSVLRAERDLIVLSDGEEALTPAPSRGWLAPAIMGVTLLLAALNPDAIGELMLGGALALVLARVLTMDQVYRAIEWRTVFLIAGTLPIGIALSKTGLAGLMANQLLAYVGGAGPMALLAGLLVLTTVLNLMIPGNGATVAAMMTPIAIQAAHQIGAEPRALAMAVALGTSMAFMTPMGHPVNILVMSSGGYRFRDYLVVGLPLTLLLWAAVIVLLPVFWPLVPR